MLIDLRDQLGTKLETIIIIELMVVGIIYEHGFDKRQACFLMFKTLIAGRI